MSYPEAFVQLLVDTALGSAAFSRPAATIYASDGCNHGRTLDQRGLLSHTVLCVVPPTLKGTFSAFCVKSFDTKSGLVNHWRLSPTPPFKFTLHPTRNIPIYHWGSRNIEWARLDQSGSLQLHGNSAILNLILKKLCGLLFRFRDPTTPSFSAGDMKYHFPCFLDSNAKQLEQAGTPGHQLLAQQTELDERIRLLQEIDADKLARDRYCELAETLSSHVQSAFSSITPSPPQPPFSPPEEHEPPNAKAPTSTTTAQSRRSKQVSHRADNGEFAVKIGSRVLGEVRRLQSLLGERDQAIQNLKKEKSDLEKSVESLRAALRLQETNTDKYQESGNVHVTLHDPHTLPPAESKGSAKREIEDETNVPSLHGAPGGFGSSPEDLDDGNRSEDDAEETIRPLRLRRLSSYYAPMARRTYVDQGVDPPPLMVAPRVEEPVAVQDPVKPETNEISTQTEEWAPLPPPPVPVAVTTPPSLPISQQRTSSLSRVSSVISLVHDEAHVCVALSEVQSVADKKRPPAPSLPPSLRAPSPDIPERHFGVLPPRPSSPTPPERTTALSFDSVPMLRGSTDTGGYLHQRGSSMPSSLQHTLGLRSATNSTVSLVSEHDVSQRSSINSRPDPTAEAADAVVVHAVTQTMIGEFLFKYMRKAIGKGYGERRHKRFFWVHPYTETLYWSSEDPRSSNVSESTAKSAYIEDVRSVLDPNPIPPGLYQYSIVVSTPEREIKITAPTKERHDIWLNALAYLLAARPHTSNHSPSNALQVAQGPMSDVTDDDRWSVSTSPQSRPSTRSAERGDVWNTSPRREGSRLSPSAGGSLSKRSRTSFEYPRWSGPESPSSPSKSLVDVPEDLEFEFHGAAMEENESDDFENVCTYCDGKHAVGHHHHRLTENVSDEGIPARPVSSSGWSFHSGAGSTNSRDRGSFFTWGHKEGAKRRFGSPRFGKAPVV